MKTVLDILLFPVGVLIEAFVGMLYPAENAKMRKHRRAALVSLAGCIGVFGVVALLSAIDPDSLAMAPLIGAGLLLLLGFLIAGKMCADDAESGRRPNRC